MLGGQGGGQRGSGLSQRGRKSTAEEAVWRSVARSDSQGLFGGEVAVANARPAIRSSDRPVGGPRGILWGKARCYGSREHRCGRPECLPSRLRVPPGSVCRGLPLGRFLLFVLVLLLLVLLRGLPRDRPSTLMLHGPRLLCWRYVPLRRHGSRRRRGERGPAWPTTSHHHYVAATGTARHGTCTRSRLAQQHCSALAAAY